MREYLVKGLLYMRWRPLFYSSGCAEGSRRFISTSRLGHTGLAVVWVSVLSLRGVCVIIHSMNGDVVEG